MNTKNLEIALTPWMRHETWHTLHPMDEQRFHHALSAAIGSLGTAQDEGMFVEAIRNLVAHHHPKLLPDKRDEEARYWARRAEHVVSYVRDTASID